MPFVYILQSLRDGRFYIGNTANIGARWKHHKSDFTHSTKRFGKLKIILTQHYTTLEEARFVERRLKNMKRKDYIEKIVREGYIKIRNTKSNKDA